MFHKQTQPLKLEIEVIFRVEIIYIIIISFACSRVVFCHVEPNDTQPFLAAKLLLLELLHFDVLRPHTERETYMYHNFKNPVILENIPLLNNLLYMKVS